MYATAVWDLKNRLAYDRECTYATASDTISEELWTDLERSLEPVAGRPMTSVVRNV